MYDQASPGGPRKVKPWMIGLGIGCVVLLIVAIIVGVVMLRGCSMLLDVGKEMTVSELRMAIMGALEEGPERDAAKAELDELERLTVEGKVSLPKIIELSELLEKGQKDDDLSAREVQDLRERIRAVVAAAE